MGSGALLTQTPRDAGVGVRGIVRHLLDYVRPQPRWDGRIGVFRRHLNLRQNQLWLGEIINYPLAFTFMHNISRFANSLPLSFFPEFFKLSFTQRSLLLGAN